LREWSGLNASGLESGSAGVAAGDCGVCLEPAVQFFQGVGSGIGSDSVPLAQMIGSMEPRQIRFQNDGEGLSPVEVSADDRNTVGGTNNFRGQPGLRLWLMFCSGLVEEGDDRLIDAACIFTLAAACTEIDR
jgi:hypothetical protein